MRGYHIDLFMPRLSRYNVLHHFTMKFCDALERQGQVCRLLTLEKNGEVAFFRTLIETSPDLTFTFNPIPPSDGVFLCDTLHIPHLSLLVDSSAVFFLAQSKAPSIICCIPHSGFLHPLTENPVKFLKRSA